MKIRIKGNSIRYRLTRPEVEQFGAEGIIKEETHFGNQILTYILKVTDASVITADLIDYNIVVKMPAAQAKEWTTTERVGFEKTESPLNIFIEKDFKCLDNVAEDQSDNYPNPLATQGHE